MKILSIQAAYFPMIGGAEVFHQKTAEWLVKKGHQVDVVTCIWDKPDVLWKKWASKQESINGVKIYRVKPWFYSQYLKTLGAIWPLYDCSLQLIKVRKYDLIHVHIFPALIVGGLLKLKTGLPLVTTIQGGDLADYSETGSKLGWLIKPIISWSLKRTDIVHTVSTHMEKAVKLLGVKNTKVIPNGVDPLFFKPRNKALLRKKYGFGDDQFIVISNSRLTFKNGLDILIKAIGKLDNKEEVLVLLVGGGEHENNLKSLVKKLQLEKTVKFFGYQDRKAIAELLSASDLFVRPSRQEGFGIAFLEAMASSLPVIGTKVGGITEIIEDKVDGYLIKSNDAKMITYWITRLRKDRILCYKLGSRGRKKVIKYYSWKEVSNSLKKIYEKITQ